MPLILVPVTLPTDIPSLTHLHLSAFMLVRINQAVYHFGLTPSITASTESRHLNFLLHDPTARYLKVIDTDLGDKPIAMAEWHIFPTASSETSRLDLGPRVWPQDVNLPLCKEFWGHIVRARKSMKEIPHVFLSIIATDPEHGRRGAGKMLMSWGVDEADRRNLPMFLESSPFGAGLYKGFGFVEREELSFEVDVSREGDRREMYRHLVMVRPAKTEGV